MKTSTQESTPLTSSSSPRTPLLPPHPNPPLNEGETETIILLSLTLNEIILKNARKRKTKVKKDIFYTKNIPTLSIMEYLHRIVKYTRIEMSVLKASVICITFYINHNKNYISLNNIHRLLLASVFVNAKYHQDINFSIKFYAKVGGVSIEELKQLESEFFSGLNFQLKIEENIFAKYKAFFNEKKNKIKFPFIRDSNSNVSKKENEFFINC